MAPTPLARTRSRTLSLLLLSCLIAAGCSKPADPAPAAESEFDVLLSTKALSLTSSVNPTTVSAGSQVALAVQITATRTTSIDVVVVVTNSSGGVSYKSTGIDGRPIGPSTPLSFQELVSTSASDPSGTWIMSVTVRHTATGKVLIDSNPAAAFTVTGGTTPTGGGGGSTGGGGGSGTGACAGSAVFCDDFTDPSLGSSYSPSTGRGTWVRATGSYTAKDEAKEWQRSRSLLSGDYTDFDVTLQARSLGAAGFGFTYAAQEQDDDGFAVIIHPVAPLSTSSPGVYLKGLVPNESDVDRGSNLQLTLAPETPMKLRVRRVGTTVTVWLDDQQVLSRDDGGTGRHGKLGLLLSLINSNQLSGSGAVFTLLRVDQATQYGSGGGGGGSSTGAWLSGASGDYVVDGSFGQWRGRDVEIAGTWNDGVEGQTALYSLVGDGDYVNWRKPIDVAVGAIYVKSGESWSAAANGAYKDRWITCLQNLKTAREGKGTTYIRFAHEFNLESSNWRVTSADLDDFKTAWKLFYDLKGQYFSEGKLVWCPNDGTSESLGIDVRDAYPDGAVDVIGIDSYNNWPAAGTAQEVQDKFGSYNWFGDKQPLGLDTWRDFAVTKNRPMAIPEWSGSAVNSYYVGEVLHDDPVDNPAYMDGFHAWLVDHAGSGPGQVLYEILFNIAKDYGCSTAPESTGGKYQLYPEVDGNGQPLTNQPETSARYRELW